VKNNNGFWIGWLELLHLIHSHSSGLQAIIALLLFYTLSSPPLHTLRFSIFTSRILATDLSEELSLQITKKSSCHFFFNRLGMRTLQNSNQFSNAKSLVYSTVRVRVRVRVRVTLRLVVYRQSIRLGAEPLETYGQNSFLNWTPAVTVRHSQLLLALASAFILGSESSWTRDYILLSQIGDFLRLAGLWWRYSTPPHSRYVGSAQTYRKQVSSVRMRGAGHTENIAFPIVAKVHLPRRCLAIEVMLRARVLRECIYKAVA
jgi:hypothetical protein